MQITLSPELEQLVQPQIVSGNYQTEIVEVTKAYWEKNLIVKAIVTYIDD